ncbi:MAG: hypothetical protein WBG50_12970 [Desulfomonilaceae bacterium]
MTRYALFFLVLVFFAALLGPQVTMSQKADPTIVDFKIQALYRAAKLTWATRDGLKAELSVQILRAETFEQGPYKEVDVIKLEPGKNTYQYVDKSMGVESKYYYKLFVKETGEYFGPIPVRPYFSPPATQLGPHERHGPLFALREVTR